MVGICTPLGKKNHQVDLYNLLHTGLCDCEVKKMLGLHVEESLYFFCSSTRNTHFIEASGFGMVSLHAIVVSWSRWNYLLIFFLKALCLYQPGIGCMCAVYISFLSLCLFPLWSLSLVNFICKPYLFILVALEPK